MPEQRHQPEEAEVGVAASRPRPAISCAIVAAGRGEQRDLVGLALDPRLRERHRRGLAAGRSARRRRVNCDERVVDLRLRDRHRVRPVVADGQLDRARARARSARPRAPRPAARCARPGPGRRARRTAPTPRAISSSGTSAEQPGRARRPARPRRARRRRAPPSASTSKKPMPAELGELGLVGVEHVTCPGYGKRHSRIPRWPWHSMTVSVSSRGSQRRARSGSSRRGCRAGGTS